MIAHLKAKLKELSALSTQEIAQHEPFWAEVRRAYQVTDAYINLENGFYGAMPEVTLEAQIRHTREINHSNTFFMRTQKDEALANLKVSLSSLIGCKTTEIAFTRNSTESLNIVISGIGLQKGDEIVTAKQDYPSGLEALDQRTQKEGIKKVVVDLPLLPKSEEEIVQCFEQAITPQTKLLILTHLVHWTGQILPAKKICEMAHKKGVEVMVDSSHALGQVEFQVAEMGCDYWVANLQKWIAAPLTVGLLVVKTEKIHRISPLFGSTKIATDDIRKLESTLAIPMPIFLTIFDALDFHYIFGTALKGARLDYMKNYWASRAKNIPNVQINTPLETGKSAAIANFSIAGKNAKDIATELFEQYKIFSIGFETDFINGVRITPQFYNSLADLDKLVAAIGEMAKK
jgi:selenocysteine lyase/cysteine desulfurase